MTLASDQRWPVDRFTMHFTSFDINANTIVIPAVFRQRIKVTHMLLIVSDDVDVDIVNTGGGALIGTLSLAGDGNGFVLPPAQPNAPWFQTNPGNGVQINLTAAVQVGGCIVYYVE